jgi:hypothetical protein
VYYNNIRDILVTRTREILIVRYFGYIFLLYNSFLQVYFSKLFESNPCYFTEVELQRLYYRFGHLSIKRLQKILDQAGYNINKKTLEHFTKYYYFCQKHNKSLGCFCFTLQDNIKFNYYIIVDIIYINNSPLLYIIDERIYFQAGR